MRRRSDQAILQDQYHLGLFGAVRTWPEIHQRIVDFTEDQSRTGLMGLDQMGHFGPQGCDLVVEEVRQVQRVLNRPLRIAELGSGFGGALRHIVDNLRRLGVHPVQALGMEIVFDHCRVADEIEAEFPDRLLRSVCADVAQLPIRQDVFDVVIATGSLPHFADPGRVFAEACRVLRPGGTLILTEEVSLFDPNRQVSAQFRKLHPVGVFFLTAVEDRLSQLASAGFADVDLRDLRQWGTELVHSRLRALRLFRGTCERIYGREQTSRIEDTLQVTHAEYVSGTLLPAMIIANKPSQVRDNDGL